MGIAAYNRGSHAIARDIDIANLAIRNSLEARTLAWRDLLEQGAILTFRAPDGAVITAGSHHTAVPARTPQFALYREGGSSRFRGSWRGSAWAIALRITDNVGRARPLKAVWGRPPTKEEKS